MSGGAVRRRALEAELAEISREQQREKRKARDAARAAARQWSFNETVLRTVLIIHALCEGVAMHGAKYLASVGVQHKWKPKTEEEFASI